MKLQQSFCVALVVGLALFTGACQKNSSPSATIKAHFKAMKAGDVESYKKTLSSKTLQRYEERAKQSKKPLDAALKEQMAYLAQMDQPDEIETRGEVIDGVNATVDFNNGRTWRTVKFIKEDGDWKIVEDAPN